jgi:2-polyprenyl-3-methyl-5-hydroxy-6-metoxy-1,4-benzoquinol methylase
MKRDEVKEKFFEQRDRELEGLIDATTGKVRQEIVRSIPCPLCRGDSYTQLFTKKGFDFVRCNVCSFVYVNPQLIEEKIIEAYTEGYNAKSSRIWKDVLVDSRQFEFNTVNFGFLISKTKEVVRSGKLLDVGCSIGHFLDLARKSGFEVEGMELEPKAIEYARRHYNVLIHEKKLEDARFPSESYDVVSLLGLIEHLPQPREFMREVYRITKPGGALILSGVPNVESLAVMTLHEDARMFHGRNHLGYYSVNTLERLLGEAGFRIKFYDTYVSCLDSILNEGQQIDPFAEPQISYLPEKLKQKITDPHGRSEIEQLLYEFDLGYKIRAVAVKE